MYVAIKSIMIKIKVEGSCRVLSSQLVNMYYGKTIFKLEGHFQRMRSISEKGFPVYFFHFKKQTPCSSAKVFEDIIDHDPLNETESVAVLSKMKENIFGGDRPNPGNDYYCPTGVVSVEWSENAASDLKSNESCIMLWTYFGHAPTNPAVQIFDEL